MPVFVVENRARGNRAHATINEGLGRVLRFGANDDSVVARLRWLATEAGPLLGAGLREAGGLDLRTLMAQALRMGDEMHQRNLAASALLTRALMPHLARVGGRHHALARLAEFVAGNDQFFLNLAMAAGKAMADPAAGVADSTLVTTMARNGTEFGIRVSALGERWLTAPVEMPVGLYFPGFGPADANPDMGDSAIVETIGLGGVAMAASPAVAGFVGVGGLADALATTEAMREISAGEHPRVPHSNARRSRQPGGRGRAASRRDRRHTADQHRHRRAAGRHRPGRRRRGARAARLLHRRAGSAERQQGLEASRVNEERPGFPGA